MKSLYVAICVAAVFAAGYFVRGLVVPGEFAVEAQSRPEAAGGRCSNRTLNGSYGIKFEGQKIGAGPFVSVSRITFDGNGQFTTAEIGRFNGSPINRTFTGPYTVNDDCTGFLDFSSTISVPPHEAHGNFVIVDNGKEFYVVDNEEGWAANGVGKKL
jgi:hypothetical protein